MRPCGVVHEWRARSMHDERENLEQGVRLERSGDLDNALRVYETVAANASTPTIVAEALRRKSSVYRQRCDWDLALEAARASAQTAIRAELPEDFAEALNAEAAVYLSRGDYIAAVPLLEQILAISDDPRIRGLAHQNLGHIAAHSMKLEQAREHFRVSRESFRRAGYRRGEAITLNNEAAILNLAGDHKAASVAAREAVEIAKAIGDHSLQTVASLNQAESLVAIGELGEAETLATTALEYFDAHGDKYRQIGCLRLLGDIHRRERRFDMAVRCYKRAHKIAEGIDAQVERAIVEDRLADLEGLALT